MSSILNLSLLCSKSRQSKVWVSLLKPSSNLFSKESTLEKRNRFGFSLIDIRKNNFQMFSRTIFAEFYFFIFTPPEKTGFDCQTKWRQFSFLSSFSCLQTQITSNVFQGQSWILRTVLFLNFILLKFSTIFSKKWILSWRKQLPARRPPKSRKELREAVISSTTDTEPSPCKNLRNGFHLRPDKRAFILIVGPYTNPKIPTHILDCRLLDSLCSQPAFMRFANSRDNGLPIIINFDKWSARLPNPHLIRCLKFKWIIHPRRSV